MSSDEYRELKELIEQRFGGLEGRFGGLEGRFDGLEGRFAAIEAALLTTAAETRAHFDVVAEKFRDDVRTIADGYDHHTTVLDNHEARLQRLEQARLRFDG